MVSVTPSGRRDEAQHLVGERHQRHDHDQHGRDVDQQLDALARALGDGVHAGVRRIVDDDVARLPAAAVAVLGASSGTISSDSISAAGTLMTEATIRCPAAPGTTGQDGGVEGEHRAGDARHADRHGGEQAAAAHGGEVGAHQQRRLHHADEDVGRRRRADRAGDAERALQHPADAVHDHLQHAPVIEQPRQRADHQDQRQGLEGQDEAGLGPHGLERRRPAGEIAEHQPHAGIGGGLQRGDQPRRPVEGDAHGRHVQHDAGDEELQAEARQQRRSSRAGATARRFSERAQAISGMATKPMRLCACSAMRRPRSPRAMILVARISPVGKRQRPMSQSRVARTAQVEERYLISDTYAITAHDYRPPTRYGGANADQAGGLDSTW